MQYFERLAALPSLAELRSRAAAYARHFRLDRAIRAARATATGTLPDAMIAEIGEFWGYPRLAASDGYVHTLLAEAQKAHGHVLQCGADLTTLLLALQLERRGVRLWTVENNVHASNTLRSLLAQYELSQAHIIATPADLTHDGVGYAIDAARLPAPLTLVVCDASNAHPGSARRLLPSIEDKLPANAVLLVRNVRRRGDFDYLAEWCRASHASFVVKGKIDPFAKIVLRDRTAEVTHEVARINTAFAKTTSAKLARPETTGAKSVRAETTGAMSARPATTAVKSTRPETTGAKSARPAPSGVKAKRVAAAQTRVG